MKEQRLSVVSNTGDLIGKVIHTLTKIMHLKGDGRSLVYM